MKLSPIVPGHLHTSPVIREGPRPKSRIPPRASLNTPTPTRWVGKKDPVYSTHKSPPPLLVNTITRSSARTEIHLILADAGLTRDLGNGVVNHKANARYVRLSCKRHALLWEVRSALSYSQNSFHYSTAVCIQFLTQQ
ncbi:hypothetical protein TNCT_96821 [Trichonephila clavata]|uniref:Uncharacterized protein n=1 Tax=Trichonephila clavata TaxID=2740835 RepID=A0A8X6LFT5_TRICU|nr:hypothetical protein TNCT_96821 [Trichonephila clavata]